MKRNKKFKFFHFRKKTQKKESYPYARTICGLYLGKNFVQNARLPICDECDRKRGVVAINRPIYGGSSGKNIVDIKLNRVTIVKPKLIVEMQSFPPTIEFGND